MATLFYSPIINEGCNLSTSSVTILVWVCTFLIAAIVVGVKFSYCGFNLHIPKWLMMLMNITYNHLHISFDKMCISSFTCKLLDFFIEFEKFFDIIWIQILYEIYCLQKYFLPSQVHLSLEHIFLLKVTFYSNYSSRVDHYQANDWLGFKISH